MVAEQVEVPLFAGRGGGALLSRFLVREPEKYGEFPGVGLTRPVEQCFRGVVTVWGPACGGGRADSPREERRGRVSVTEVLLARDVPVAPFVAVGRRVEARKVDADRAAPNSVAPTENLVERVRGCGVDDSHRRHAEDPRSRASDDVVVERRPVRRAGHRRVVGEHRHRQVAVRMGQQPGEFLRAFLPLVPARRDGQWDAPPPRRLPGVDEVAHDPGNTGNGSGKGLGGDGLDVDPQPAASLAAVRVRWFATRPGTQRRGPPGAVVTRLDQRRKDDPGDRSVP